MENKFKILFIVAVLGGSLVVLFATIVNHSQADGTTIYEFPSFYSEEGINDNFGQDYESYLSNNIGFRKKLLEGQCWILGKCFKTSPIKSVIIGNSGELFYAETLDDYLGIPSMDKRQLYNCVRTLYLVNEAVEEAGGTFVFTIAPNKNSLYEGMPYNTIPSGESNSFSEFSNLVADINWVNLYQCFEEKGDDLYYKTDSHWNKIGAEVAYKELMLEAGREPIDFKQYALGEEQINGDLARMLHPYSLNVESSPIYDIPESYNFATATRSVEEAYIQTYNENKIDSLYMFRDSFGNNLIDYFSNSYRYCTYDKYVPYDFSKAIAMKPDTIILEIVERNLQNIQSPGVIIEAHRRENTEELVAIKKDQIKMKVEAMEVGIQLEGTYIGPTLPTNCNFYAKVGEQIYELTPCTIEENTYGFTGLIGIADIRMSDTVTIMVNGRD